MASTCSTSTPRKEKASLPPKRGKIKAKIFRSLVKFAASKVSKVGKVTGNNGEKNNGGGGCTGSSTPPPGAYNNSHIK